MNEMFRDRFEYEVEKAEEILNDYSLEELFEENDVTEAEVLAYLITSGYITYPETIPTTVDRSLEGDEE